MVFGARLRVAPGGQFCRENLEAGAPDSASGGGNKGTCVVCRGWQGYSETPRGPEAAPQPPALLGRFTSHTQQPTWRPAPPSRHRSGCQRWCASRSRGGRALLCCHGGPGQLRARLCPGLAGGHGPSGLLAKPESPLCPQQARCGPHSAAGVYSHPVSVVTRGCCLSPWRGLGGYLERTLCFCLCLRAFPAPGEHQLQQHRPQQPTACAPRVGVRQAFQPSENEGTAWLGFWNPSSLSSPGRPWGLPTLRPASWGRAAGPRRCARWGPSPPETQRPSWRELCGPGRAERGGRWQGRVLLIWPDGQPVAPRRDHHLCRGWWAGGGGTSM